MEADPQPPENDNAVTRAHLETLTTPELIKMADSLGVDIPYDLDRIFIIEELLLITSLDTDTPGESPELDMKDLVLVESAPLPRQYNITYVDVMIRDPLWAFVFWEIKAQDKEQFEKSQDFEGYYLKVSLMEKSADSFQAVAEGGFTVPVEPGDSAWYLGLRPAFADVASLGDQHHFKVELCAGLKGEETIIASSIPARLPGLPELPNKAGKQEGGNGENQLVRLSGYGDFHIIRRNERSPRTKRSAAAGSYE